MARHLRDGARTKSYISTVNHGSFFISNTKAEKGIAACKILLHSISSCLVFSLR